jgi:hypothetical protein
MTGIKQFIPLHDYQVEALREVTSTRTGILKAPTGSGKSLMMLSWMLLKGAERIIYVVPPELIDAAPEELEFWIEKLPEEARYEIRHLESISGRRKADGNWGIYGLPRRCIIFVAWCNMADLELEVSAILTGLPELYALVEIRSQDRPKWAQELELAPYLEGGHIVFDEAQAGNEPQRWTKDPSKAVDWIPSWNTPNGRRMYALASQGAAGSRCAERATHRLVATASTITEHREDIYGLLRLVYDRKAVKFILGLDGEGYLSDFKSKYCGATYTGYNGSQETHEPTNSPELIERLKRVMHSVPNSEYSKLLFKVNQKTECLTRVKPWYKTPKTVDSSVMGAMERIAAPVQYLREHLDRSLTSLIFCEFKETAALVARELDIPLISGAVKRPARRLLLADHRLSGGPLVATVHSLGHGFNLQYTQQLWTIEIPIRLDLWLQAVARAQRQNRSEPLDLRVLTVKGSKDARVFDVWSRKAVQTRELSAHDPSIAEDSATAATAVDWMAVARSLKT